MTTWTGIWWLPIIASLPVPFPALLSLCPAPFPPIVTSSPCRIPIYSAAHVQVGTFKVTVRVCVRPQQVGPVQLGFVSSLHCPHPAASVRSESVIVFVSVCPSPALPAKFTKGLRKEEAVEGSTAKLCCELSKAAPVEWRKGPETLRTGDRLRVKQEGAVCELEICELILEDAGEYSCVCGQETTSATLTVRGKDHVQPVEQRLRVCGL